MSFVAIATWLSLPIMGSSFDFAWRSVASNLDDFHPGHWLFAPGIFCRPARGAANIFLQVALVRALGIVPLDRLVECTANGTVDRLRDPFDDDRRVGGDTALAVQDKRERDHSGMGQPAAVA